MNLDNYFNRERWEIDLGPKFSYLGESNVIFRIGKHINLCVFRKKKILIDLSLLGKFVIQK